MESSTKVLYVSQTCEFCEILYSELLGKGCLDMFTIKDVSSDTSHKVIGVTQVPAIFCTHSKQVHQGRGAFEHVRGMHFFDAFTDTEMGCNLTCNEAQCERNIDRLLDNNST